MSDVMLQLGTFQFSTDTGAYQRLSRSTSYRWARTARIQNNDALEFAGYGADAIDLAGVIYPHYRGGLKQLDKLRGLAGLGRSLPLISGQGRPMGWWVVEEVGETQSAFFTKGAPLKQEFSLKLGRADRDGTIGNILALLGW